MNKSTFIAIFVILTSLFTVACEEEKDNSITTKTPLLIPNMEMEEFQMAQPTLDATEEEIVEECTKSEIQLNNGECVINKCNEEFCGNNGICHVDNQTGDPSCECPIGFDSNEGSFDCMMRSAQYDIESQTREYFPSIGTGKEIASWTLYTNNAEEASITYIEFKVNGSSESFTNFTLYVNGQQFSGVSNDFCIASTPLFRFILEEEERDDHIIPKNSAIEIKLYADVEGNMNDQIEIGFGDFEIRSTELHSEGPFSYAYPLAPNAALGANQSLSNSFFQQYEANMTSATIQ